MKKIYLYIFFIIFVIISLNAYEIDVRLKDGMILTIPADQLDTFQTLYSRDYHTDKTFKLDEFTNSVSFLGFTDTNQLSQIYKNDFFNNIIAVLGESYNNNKINIGFISEDVNEDDSNTTLKSINSENVHLYLNKSMETNEDKLPYLRIPFNINKVINKNNTNDCSNTKRTILQTKFINTYSNWFSIDKKILVKGIVTAEVDGFKSLNFTSEYLMDKNVIFILLKLKINK